MDKRKRELLEQANWEEIILHLLKYALTKLMRLNIRSSCPLGGMNLNETAQDQVFNAIGKLWDETVTWDYEKKDDLLIHLKGIIKSQVSHICDNKEYLQTIRFPVNAENNDSVYVEVEEMINIANPQEEHAEGMSVSTPLDPEEVLLSKEQAEDDKSAQNVLIERLNGDKELEEMILCIMCGFLVPRDIAKEMGVDVRHVNNLQKKLRRIYKDLRKEKLQ